jgi:hypothetical protein
MSKQIDKQRCIGPYMSHDYILNHTLSFSRSYSDLNQWIYIHLSAAHESTGQHAETLDLDLVNYLDNYLTEFGKSHDVVIFLEADHGMRYGHWYRSVEAFQETRLPVFFVISHKKILDNIEYSYDTLQHNTLRINSKLDLRKTLIYLSGYPYGLNIQSKENYRAINLFTEKAYNNRTCSEMGIPPFHCSCLVLKKLELENNEEEVNEYLHMLAEQAIYSMNSQVYTSHDSKLGSICRRLSLHKIESAYALELNSKMEEVKLELSINESKEFRIEVTFLVSTLGRPKRSEFISEAIISNGYRKTANILNFLRLDEYAGTCEILSRERNLNPEFCVCKKIEDIEDKQFLERIFNKYNITE